MSSGQTPHHYGRFLSLCIKSYCAFAITCIFLSPSSQATHAQALLATQAAFKSLESNEIQYLSPTQCQLEYTQSELSRLSRIDQLRATVLGHKTTPPSPSLLNWIPTAEANHVPSPGCEVSALEKGILAGNASIEAQANSIQNYFKKCDSELRQDNPEGSLALFELEKAQYNFCDHPHMKKVVIRLPNGDLIRGILALKADSKPHPFVIAKCGALCDPGDPSLRFMMMHLYDESPFDVLALANVTGPSFARDNGFIALGGLYEGQEIIEIAEMLRKSALQSRISSIHFVGVSLGSHGGLYASLMNSYNVPADGKPLLTSTLAACPVVDLEASMKSLFSDSIQGLLAHQIYDHAVSEVINTIPNLASLFIPNLTTEQIPDAVAESATHYLRTLKPGWALPPFQNSYIGSRREFWKQNQFLNYLSEPFTTPTLLIAGEDDQIVPIVSNTERLKKELARIRRHRSTLLEANLGAVTISSGDHCAFNEVYGWQTASTLFRSYILSRSPEMQARHHDNVVYFSQALYNQQAVVFAGEEQYIQSFAFEAELPALIIRYKILMPFRTGCGGLPSFLDPLLCYREETKTIPFAALDFGGVAGNWAHTPMSDAEAQAMTRWANVHMKLLSPKGKNLAFTKELGAQLHWDSY